MTYIPRSALGARDASSPIPKMVKKKHTFHVFAFIGTLLIVGAVLATGGVFFLKSVSLSQLEQAKQELSAVSNAADSASKVREIQLYDQQLRFAGMLLDNHIAPSKIFQEIELSTKETVQFRSFEYEYDPGFQATLTLGGVTQAFSSIVLQEAQVEGLSPLFDVGIISGIAKGTKATDDEKGALLQSGAGQKEITFDLKGLLLSERLKYKGGDIPTAPVVIGDVSLPGTEDTMGASEDFEFDNDIE